MFAPYPCRSLIVSNISKSGESYRTCSWYRFKGKFSWPEERLGDSKSHPLWAVTRGRESVRGEIQCERQLDAGINRSEPAARQGYGLLGYHRAYRSFPRQRPAGGHGDGDARLRASRASVIPAGRGSSQPSASANPGGPDRANYIRCNCCHAAPMCGIERSAYGYERTSSEGLLNVRCWL